MIDVMRFSFIYYLRSYRYFAPLLIYLLAVIFVYGVVPNPIMPSFAFTSTLLFVISAWLTFGYIDVEDQTQQMITVVIPEMC